MSKVNIKIGNNTFSDVAAISVDNLDGGSANFIYEGYMPKIDIRSKIKKITKITSNIYLPTITINSTIIGG